MRRISGSGATLDGRFKETPAPATRLDSDWLNVVQDEWVNLIVDAAGGNLALDPDDTHQVRKAIQAMIARAVGAQLTAKKGLYRAPIVAGNSYRVDFTAAFPPGTQYVLSLTDANLTANGNRDNWVQRAASDEAGFYVFVNGAYASTSGQLDGFDWVADPL